MVLESFVSLLGGGLFRAIIGEASQALKARQERKAEIELIQAQSEAADAEHRRQREMIELQARLGVQTIQTKGEQELAVAEAMAFRETVSQATKSTGIYFIDFWNGAIRPSYATLALALWALSLWQRSFVLTDWDTGLIGAIIGFYFADRSLRKMGR